MTLHQLVIFRTIVEKGSFIRAAEHLKISQPAISTQLKLLEHELGHAMIKRKPATGKVELTPAGEITYKATIRILEEVEQLMDELKFLNKIRVNRQQLIKVICDDLTGTYILPNLVAEFRRDFPNVNIRIICTAIPTAERMLHEETYDLALLPVDINTPRCVQEFTYTINLTAVTNPKLLEQCKSNNWHDLPFILPPPDNTLLRRRVEAYFKKIGVTPNIVMELGSPELARRTLINEPFATIIFKIVIQEDLKAGLLVELPVPEKLPVAIHKVVYKQSQSNDHTRAFINFLREKLTVCID
ncbi:LysR family transcriptional regulator [Moorella sulfitireducens]|uniref:LysR family transcriptional regulator n=1 Tax=Neomoorella sulfitireducens TaxID=2972948 RepID=UPI0021AD4FB7|nr:LysR family transcriptional regulator [Moorella sulfitireducens]